MNGIDYLKGVAKKVFHLPHTLGNYVKYGKNVTIASSARISSKAIIRAEYGGAIDIGPHCEVGEFAIIKSYGGLIQIEQGSFIGPLTVLYGHGGLKIGQHVKIAAQCVVIPSNHNFCAVDKYIYEQGETSLGITIEDDVWVASGVKILDGVCIRKGCVIGAGAVVTRSTEAYCVYAGVPSKKMRLRFETISEII